MGFLDYVVNEKAVVCNLEVSTWEESIIQGGQSMVDKGITTPEYMTTIIEKCKANGPYIVVAPGVAMPHARPEEGALKLGYSVVTLKNPVVYKDPDNDPISLLIFMAAPDVKLHNEEAVSQIADLLDDEEVVEKMMNATSEDELIEILKGFEA